MKPNVFFAEFLGTFTLVFIGAGAAAAGTINLLGVALIFGLIIASMIYVFGEISGTHINPAVTFALALNGNLTWTKAVFYWIAQFVGGIIAAAALLFVFGGAQNGLGATLLASGVSPLQGLAVETIGTFILMTVIFFAAVKGYAGKSASLIIALTVIVLILFAGPLSGAGFNPARSFGPALFTGTLALFWIYLLGPLAGAALAVLFYRLITKKT
jgi:aquaporin Z